MIANLLRLCLLLVVLLSISHAQLGYNFYGGPRVLTTNSFYQYYRPYPSVLAYPGVPAAPVVAAAPAVVG